MDSYDKLRRYGLCINGAIDGYSRYVIWMNVTNTASDPRVVASNFIEAGESNNWIPLKMRADRGIENGHVQQMHNFLSGNENSFIYGKSTGNERIEMFWGHLRRACAQQWIEKMGMLEDENLFSGNALDRSLVQFVFMDLLQVRINTFLH